jgi:hypothetical protein
MNDTIGYQVTRLGRRYGVHVDNMTKGEACAIMSTVADVKHGRDGRQSTLERADILAATETPVSLDPSPIAERWFNRIVIGFFAFGLLFYALHDIVRDLLK